MSLINKLNARLNHLDEDYNQFKSEILKLLADLQD
jgi:hypothetical protein